MILLDAALVVLALALVVATVRLVIGPTDADRALAVDFGFAVVLAAVALLAVAAAAADGLVDTGAYVDAVTSP